MNDGQYLMNTIDKKKKPPWLTLIKDAWSNEEEMTAYSGQGLYFLEHNG